MSGLKKYAITRPKWYSEVTTPTPTYINDREEARLYAIAKEHGMSRGEVKKFLLSKGYVSAGAIKWVDYDAIIREIEEFSKK